MNSKFRKAEIEYKRKGYRQVTENQLQPRNSFQCNQLHKCKWIQASSQKKYAIFTQDHALMLFSLSIFVLAIFTIYFISVPYSSIRIADANKKQSNFDELMESNRRRYEKLRVQKKIQAKNKNQIRFINNKTTSPQTQLPNILTKTSTHNNNLINNFINFNNIPKSTH